MAYWQTRIFYNERHDDGRIMKEMKGLYTALITPFTQEGVLDREGLRRNLRFQLQNNVDGVVVLGTTGEAPTLNSHEKDVVVEIALEELKGKVSIFVGTGTYSTETTIATTKKAKLSPL